MAFTAHNIRVRATPTRPPHAPTCRACSSSEREFPEPPVRINIGLLNAEASAGVGATLLRRERNQRQLYGGIWDVRRQCGKHPRA
jgi:hypothetical protein